MGEETKAVLYQIADNIRKDAVENCNSKTNPYEMASYVAMIRIANSIVKGLEG